MGSSKHMLFCRINDKDNVDIVKPDFLQEDLSLTTRRKFFARLLMFTCYGYFFPSRYFPGSIFSCFFFSTFWFIYLMYLMGNR